MKARNIFAGILSTMILPVLAQELDFTDPLAKLTEWEKKFVHEDPQCLIGKKPAIRLEKNRMLNTVVKLEPKTKYI